MPPQTSSAGSLDPQAVALSKAIRQQESGGDPIRSGASGEYGAYQFLPGTWDKYSQEAGVNAPLQGSTLEQQNQVAYHKIKQWKDAGYNPGQIASMWNAGEGEPNAYTGTFADGSPASGVNKEGVKYDVPDYAKNVATYYQQYKSQEPQSAQDQTQQPAEQQSQNPLVPNLSSIGDELANNIASRFQQGSTALGTGIDQLSQGHLHEAASGALQTVGAAAGGVGDIVNAGLELIPGVQAGEKAIGGVIQKVAETPTGQDIAKGINDFAQKNPEISGDIGAAINIGSILPMFKGLSLLKGGLTDAASSVLHKNLEDTAANELRGTLTKTGVTSLSRAEARGLDPLKVITADHQNLPSIVETPEGKFVYSTENAASNIQNSLSQDEEALQEKLNGIIKNNVMVSLPQARARMIKDVLNVFPVSAKGGQAVKAVNEFFDNVEPTTGGRSFISTNELNGLKRDVGSGVNWLNLGAKNGEVKAAMYQSLMKQVEEFASKNGIKGVPELNKTMGAKIEALKVLDGISGKTVKQSQIGKVLREVGADISGGAAELAGGKAGIPFASTLAGRALYRLTPGRTPLTATRLLGRSGRGTIQSSLKKGLLKSATGQALRGLVSPQQQGQ